MAFSEIESPVYGGGTIQLDLTGHNQLINQVNIQLFLVFEGELQRHITILKQYTADKYFSIIPAHHREESVQLSILCFHGNECSILGGTPFRFYYDSAFYMAQFLVESVYNVTALDDLELIRSDYFDLSNEILDTLDDRLQKALNFLDIPDWWHLLGSTSPLENPDNQTRETLLHFTARLGLNKVTLFLLNKPGSEQCLSISNPLGNLPRDIAAEQGFTDLSEILTEYNSHFVKVENKPIKTNEGIISYYDNREVSLSTYLQRSLVEEAQILHKLVETFEKSGIPSYVRQSETAWPGTEEMDTDKQRAFEDQTDSKLRAIILKSKDLQVFMEALGSNDGSSDNIIDLDSPARSLEDLSDTPSDRDTEIHDGCQAYESSLSGLHGFNQQLLQQRDSNRNTLIAQDVLRKDKLSRFSSSCPSLEVEGLLPSGIDEDHHNSMLNLSKDEEHAGASPQLAQESPSDSEETTDSPYITEPSQDTSVQICINGITVDHSSDFTLDASLNRFLRDFYGGNTPGVRRRSWGGNFLEGQKLQVRHAIHEGSLSAKSMSLNSLDGDEDTEDDDFVDAKEPPTTHVSQGGQEAGLEHPGNSPSHMDALNISPGESPCSSPNNQDMPDASIYTSPDPGETLVRTLYGLKKELISPRDRKSHQLQQELGGQSGESVDEDSRILTVPHSNITKSLSTPSIPAAVSPGERKVHKDPKQNDVPTYLLIQKLIEEHDAQFRRQDEIEEDDDENTNRLLGQSDSRRRSQVSLIDFLADSSNLEDSSKSRKEEKKRKPSVFSRLQNSYRTKKHKDKENKGKSTHQFVSVSFSNSTACHVCRKSMANKPAVRCENCLVNVHENSCKEQITPCDKGRIPKVPPQLTRESAVQMTNVTLREKQSSSLPTSVAGLRQSHSFKEKRSSSGPAGRSQVTSAPLSTVTPQPHPSLFSIPDTESVPETSAAQLQQHRRSLPTSSLLSLSPPITQGRSGYWKKARELLIGIDKPISEDVDPFLGQESGSNITDTISESLESLDDTDAPSEVNDNYDDELLMLRYDEAETWSGSIDRKIIKKMSHKDIKRQDTIWELIQTERHHCRRLKILQRVYSHTILDELHMPQEVVDRLFPNLDDLIEIHMTFLHSLQDLQNLRPDHSVDQIGETIVNQFDGESAEQMKAAYGGFCCRQKSSNLYYKDLLTKDRKFQSYMKKCNNHTLCNKREIPDFLLAVTQRPSKYLTLIEAILKSTKDKKDRENLIKALNLSRDLLHSIDEQVNQYELQQRLEEIHTKMDQRAVAIYKGKKFKRSDIIANERCLLHEGSVQLKNARGKVTDAILVVLTDLIFFMQETNGKYNFFSQDSKSSVIPLFQLLVREKGDTRADSRGIYLISQNKQNPEMYEIICANNNYRRNWIEVLRQATDGCPPEEVEEIPNEEDEEQKRLMEARAAKVKDIIEQLHHKDREIKICCDDKNKLMMELLEMYSWKKATPSAEDSTEHMDALQTAIQEVSATASRLTTMLQGSGSHLSRHVSSVGEHVSSGFSLTPLPKRAETFAGFDSSFDVPKACVPKKKYLAELQDLEGRSGSPQNVDSDSEICPVTESSTYEKTAEADDSLDSTRQYDHYSHSEAGSLGDISGSSTQSNIIHGENHLASITQLARSLHSIVHLTAQQGTAVETLRAQLAEANERINKLSAEVHERKGGYRYNQLEELRNLQEMLRKEKQAFERAKERERNYAEQERLNLEEMKQAIKLEEEKLEMERREIAAEIQSQKEDLRQDKERYQAQIMLWESQLRKDGHSSAPGVSQLSSSESYDSHTDFGQVTKRDNSPSSAQANHRRSASADFCQMIENDMDRLRQGNVKTSRREMATSRSDSRAGLSSSASKKNLPEHLLSAKNEQKVSGIKVQQQLPARSGLSGQASSSSIMGKGGSVQQVLPFKLAASGSNSSINSISGVVGPQNNSASQGQKSYHPRSNMMPNKQPSSSSSLSRIMKLAEPGSSKGRSSSLTSVPSLLLGDKSHTHKSASVDIPNSGAPQGAVNSGASQGAAQGKTDQSSEKADDEIYC